MLKTKKVWKVVKGEEQGLNGDQNGNDHKIGSVAVGIDIDETN